MDKRYRLTLKIPAWHKKRLDEWAAVTGVTATTLASNILKNRIEVNDKQARMMLESRAKDEGLTIEEFIRSIIDKTEAEPEIESEE